MVAHNLTWSLSRAPRNSHCNRHNSQRIHFSARFYILDVDINQVVFFSIDFWSKKMTSGLPPSISQRVCRWLLRVFHSSTTRRSSCRITGKKQNLKHFLIRQSSLWKPASRKSLNRLMDHPPPPNLDHQASVRWFPQLFPSRKVALPAKSSWSCYRKYCWRLPTIVFPFIGHNATV